MSDIIRLLPDAVANQIAAGEVIQRPASVVKELVENAIDAGATEVQVLITDAGRTCVQVVDNGKGMSPADALLSFERHATSKIAEASDLFSLRTMGFRGEALASIAAVAEVELRTRMADDELGTRVLIAGSRLVSQEETSCPKGSNFCVRNLFFNVPARRKFLKSNATEFNNIINEFERIVLVHPDVAFRLLNNDTEVMNLRIESQSQRIMSVFGKKIHQQLLPIEVNTSLVRLSGFVGKPEAARRKGARQYFFVNGRYMRHPYFHKAVMDAYDQLIPQGEQPPYFIYFDSDPSCIDVNIHPTKTEIKFENEQGIWQIVMAAVREALGKFSAVPTIDFDVDGMPTDMPVFNANRAVEAPRVSYDKSYNPFNAGGAQYQRRDAAKGWEELFQGVERMADEPLPQAPLPDADVFGSSPLEEVAEAVPQEAQLLQFKGRFILTSVKSGLMLVDQHRAHVRVLYDRYMRQLSQHAGTSQGVLFPEVVQFSAAEENTLRDISDDLSSMGFDLSPLGGGSYGINGIPAGAEGLDPVRLVQDLVHTAAEQGRSVRQEVQSAMALMLARSSAIVRGQALSQTEMQVLFNDLFTCADPNHTPDGKLILAIIREEDITRLF